MSNSQNYIVPRKTYGWIWVALMVLLGANLGLSGLNLGNFNVFVSLTVALVQTLLMLLFLMHVRFEPPLTRFFVLLGFVWLLILFDLSLADYFTRGAIPDALRESWKHGIWPTSTRPPPP